MNFEKLYKRISSDEIPALEKQLIETNFKFKEFKKDEIIINQENDCNRMFFIVKGAMRVFYFDKLGTEITRTFVFENEFCTNLVSFSKQDKNNENIQCMEHTLAFCISREDFYQMLGHSHLLTQLYSKVLETFITKHLKHFQFMNTLTPRERTEEFLSASSPIKERIKNKIIATYLGVTPEFYSKIKSGIKQK